MPVVVFNGTGSVIIRSDSYFQQTGNGEFTTGDIRLGYSADIQPNPAAGAGLSPVNMTSLDVSVSIENPSRFCAPTKIWARKLGNYTGPLHVRVTNWH